MTAPKKHPDLLCHLDPDVTRFRARITKTIPGKKFCKVLLDRTFFFPEGGGQPSDTGFLNGVPVVRVITEEDRIYHLAQKCPPGPVVEGIIDGDRRRKYRQQHTGQHILSALLWKMHGHQTLSVHLGRDYTAIEINTPRLNPENLKEIETEANRIIQQNLPVRRLVSAPDQLQKYPLRKECNLDKDILNLIRIGELDCVACCGLHLDATGKVGLIKVVGTEKIRGRLRVHFKIGDAAYQDYREKSEREDRLKRILKTDPDHFVEKIRQLDDQLIRDQKENRQFLARLSEMMTGELLASPDRSSPRFLSRVYHDQPDILIRRIARNLLKTDNLYFALFNRTADQTAWLLGSSKELELPFPRIQKELLPLIGGKGGGRPPLYSGICRDPRKIGKFLSALNSFIVKPV